MMMVTPRLETYNYTVMDDDSVDSDDEKYNYVIDLDYKEEDSTESSDTDKNEDKGKSEEAKDSKCESVEGSRNDRMENGYNYTLQNEVLDLRHRKRTSDVHEDGANISTEIQMENKSSYSYVLECKLTGKEPGGARIEMNLQEKSVASNIEEKNFDNLELLSPIEENGAISHVKSNVTIDVNKKCNKQSTEGSRLSVPKLVGANKRKRKFSLENAITNIMKVKAHCTRDLSINDISLSRQSSLVPASSPSSIALSDHSNLTSSTSQQSVQSLKSSSSTNLNFNIPLKTSTPAKNDTQSLSFDLNSSRHSPLLSQTLSQTSFSPTIKPSLSPTISSNQVSALYNPIKVSSDRSQSLPKDSSNRRKSYVTYHCDNDMLDKTVKKERPETKVLSCNQDGVIDLSKPSKAKSESITKAPEQPADNEPVDLSLSSRNLKDEQEMRTGYVADQLKVVDIFTDMMNQTGRAGGTVSMQQFVQWMRKIQPTVVDSMNMMQLSAYFMQFNYWMQSFLNNTYMKGVSNQTGFTSHFEPKSKERNGRRKTPPSPLTKKNLLTPESSNKEIKLERSTSQLPIDDKPISPAMKTKESKESDHNSNNINLENINFSKFPEIGTLKNQYGCQVSERDGKMKFTVRDNEEILSIVNTLMKTADLHESEVQDLDRDENGLCPKFICRVCNKKFFHQEHLSKHVKTNHVQKRFQCVQCDR